MNKTEKYILEWYINKIWTKPFSSKICDGIGMVAIRDIPKETSIFDLAEKSVYGWIPIDEAKTIPNGVLRWALEGQPQADLDVMNSSNLYDNFLQGKYGDLWAYTQKGMNWQTTWYFVNHSLENPNVSVHSTGHPRVFKYITLRDIYEGEEILENYNEHTSAWRGNEK